MPGLRLTHAERRLGEFWDAPPGNFQRPFLRQLRIEGGPGLRGINQIVVSFHYPLTVVCGRNGVGKSTVLGLAALSARPPANWRVYWGNARPRTQPDARTRYAFNDFFHRRRGAPPIEGLRLTWVSMDRGNEVEIVERVEGGRWRAVGDAGRHRRAGDRPVREIDFIPMARVLPAMEYGALRAAFNRATAESIEPLSPDSLEKLSYIMGRQYTQAETGFIRGLGLASATSGAAYTGFDMGGGESSVIVLLSRLQAIPVGGLVVIEEIELGLHAEAQIRLIEILLGFCADRRLQIICTTHSETIIDAVPRRARILLRRNGQEHEALDNVSTRFAIHEMAGRAQPELLVYTEDTFASVIVEEAIAGPHRTRVSIRDVGSNATLARQSIAHLRMNPQIKALSVFDGDCTEAQVNGWLRDERAERELHPDWLILPGDGHPPEAWLVGELTGEYRDALCRELACTAAIADGHIQAMSVQLNHHDSGFELAQRTGQSPETARRMIVRAVARSHPALQPLRDKIAEILDGAR
ncbi:AAA family ATPase [Brevundimonas sp. BR2-1]|uniref:ATP-dependent nuclease n=1 Tax=Brevundimonas sp. BR2-1 TaxID=3031123 RepID=UPI00309E67F4